MLDIVNTVHGPAFSNTLNLSTYVISCNIFYNYIRNVSDFVDILRVWYAFSLSCFIIIIIENQNK